MSQNLFGIPGAASSDANLWQVPVPLTGAGQNLTNLFNLYNSLGAFTVGAGGYSVPSTLDGPIQVLRAGALTVNGLFTTTNRCRGLLVLCDSLNVGAAGIISMSAKGAAGSPKWANQDILVPTNMFLSGKGTSLTAFMAWLASTGYAIFDPTMYACPMPGQGDVQANWSAWPGNGTAIVSASGCGAGAAGSWVTVGTGGAAGSSGGTAGGGSGGSGYNTSCFSYPGAPGRVWGGGSASGGAGFAQAVLQTDLYGGAGGVGTSGGGVPAGGGAGNPPGTGTGSPGTAGTGGILIILVRGPVSVTSGHVISANGSPGGYGPNGGGGSGGGSVSLVAQGAVTGTLNLTATGGTGGGASSGVGGAGGVGSTQVKTFSAMGY